MGAADVRRAEEELDLARVESRPDITAAAYYAHRIDYEDLAGFGVSLTLPFAQDKRLKERQAERDAELSGSRANLEMIKNDIARGVGEAYAELERSLEQAKLYQSSILPQAKTSASRPHKRHTPSARSTSSHSSAQRSPWTSTSPSSRCGARAPRRAVAALQIASGSPLLPG